MRARKLLAGLGLAAVIGLTGAGAASASETAPANPNDTREQLEIPEQTGNGDTPILSGFIDALCPAIDPPTPRSPLVDPKYQDASSATTGGLYGRYGTAGLYWTTYDQSCLSPNRLDTGTASGINEVATTLDEAVNDAQGYALDEDSTIAFDPVLASAARDIRDTLFTPWLLPAFAAVGLVIGFMAFTQSGTAAAQVGIAAVVTLGAVMFLASNPNAIPRTVDAGTAGVMRAVSTQLVETTGGNDRAGVDAEHATREAYYRATSYQAWLQGMFCGDTYAEREFGQRFLDAQAFTVTEWDRVAGDPAAQRDLTVKKQQAWLNLAQELQTERPAAFACWSGEQGGRMGAAVKHVAATIGAGTVMLVASGTVMVLRWVLRIGILLAVGLGALLLASRRITAGFLEVLVLGVVGTPVVSAIAGIALVGFSAIMSDPEQTWWQGILSVIFMGVALWWLRGPLGRILHGVGEMGVVGSYGSRRGRRMAHGYGRTSVTRGGSGSGGAAAGAVAGAAAGTVVHHHHHDSSGGDERREQRSGSDWGAPVTTTSSSSASAGADPVEPTVNVAADEQTAARASSAWASTAHEQPQFIVDQVKQAGPGPKEADVNVAPSAEQVEKVQASTRSRLHAFQEKAVAQGTPPSDESAIGAFSGDGRRGTWKPGGEA